MEQIGTVVKVLDGFALVEVKRVSACGENCANCKGGCMPTNTVARVSNPIGAVLGDTVKIESDTGKVIKAAVILYMVPVLFSIVAACVAEGLTNSGIYSAVSAVAAFFVSYLIIKKGESKIVPETKITKTLNRKV